MPAAWETVPPLPPGVFPVQAPKLQWEAPVSTEAAADARAHAQDARAAVSDLDVLLGFGMSERAGVMHVALAAAMPAEGLLSLASPVTSELGAPDVSFIDLDEAELAAGAAGKLALAWQWNGLDAADWAAVSETCVEEHVLRAAAARLEAAEVPAGFRPPAGGVLLAGPEGRMLPVVAGRADALASHAYLNGQCHALALALHAETGWPLAAVTGIGGEVIHVAVRDPVSGAVLDISGPAADADALQRLGGAEIHEISRAETESLEGAFHWARPDVRTAATFVSAVLARL